MQYLVVMSDGQKFGPATIDLLNQWIAEKRITPDTELESVIDGTRSPARNVAGLIFESVTPANPGLTTIPQPQSQASSVGQPVSSVPAGGFSASYFVIAPDGAKYGPADLQTLNQWIGQGRLTLTTQLEEEATGRRLPASSIPGLSFMAQPTPMTTGPNTSYPRPGPYANAPGVGNAYAYDEPGKKDFTTAIVLGIVGLFCCPVVLQLVGLYYAYRAQQAGSTKANIAYIVCGVTLVISIISIIVRFGMVMSALGNR